MRSLIVLLAASLTAAFYLDLEDQGFQQGQEYQYNYVSRAVTGAPGKALENSGVVVRCTVRLQFIQKTKVYAACQNPQIFTVTTGMRWQEDMPPPSELKPVMQEYIPQLSRPFQFDYNSGRVSNVQVSPDEPSFVINLKKGIMEKLQLTIDPSLARQQDPQLRQDFSKLTGEEQDLYRPPISVPRNTYSVFEDGISGNCENIYGISGSPFLDQSQGLAVIKAINYKNCVKLCPTWEEGPLSSLTTTGEGNDYRDVIDRFTHANYTIKGSRSDFLISGVRSTSKFMVRPFTEQHGIMTTTILQDLQLIRCIPISQRLNPGTKQLAQPLRFEMDNFDIGKQLQLDSRGSPFGSYQSGSSGKVQMVEQHLTALITLMRITPGQGQQVRDQTFEEVKTIQKIMSVMSEAEIKSLISKYIQASPGTEQYKKREFLLDMMAAVGTPACVFATVDLLNNLPSQVPLSRVLGIFRQMSFTVRPADSQFLEFLKPTGTPTIPKMRTDPTVRTPMLLFLGTCIHRAYHQLNNSCIPRSQVQNVLDDIAQKWIQLFQKTSDRETKMVMLKAIGNSGLPQFLPLIQKLVVDTTQSPKIRSMAIWATRRMPSTFQQQIQQIIMPAYIDQRQPTLLRTAAFTCIMHHRPTNVTIQLIINTHNNESNTHVGTLVYQTLLSISKARFPSLKPMGKQIRRLMPNVRPFRSERWEHSVTYHMESIMKEIDQSIGLDVMMLNHPEPQSTSYWIYKASLANMGKSINMVELGIRSVGAQRILEKLIGPASIMLDKIQKSSWDEINRFLLPDPIMRRSRSFDVDLDEMLSKINLQDRNILENVGASFYLKFLDVEITYQKINRQKILDLLKDSMPAPQYPSYYGSGSGSIWKTLRAMSLGRSSQVLPTPMGVCYFLNHTVFAVAHVEGSHTTSPNSWMDYVKAFLGFEQISGQMTANMNLTTVALMERTAGMNLIPVAAFIKQSVKMSSALPLTITSTVDSTSNLKISVKMDFPPQTLDNILRIKYVPSAEAIYCTLSGQSQSQLSGMYQDEFQSQSPVQLLDYPSQNLGVYQRPPSQLDIQGQWESQSQWESQREIQRQQERQRQSQWEREQQRQTDRPVSPNIIAWMPLTMPPNNKPVVLNATLPVPSMGFELKADCVFPNTKPVWVWKPNIWAVNDVLVGFKPVGGNVPIEVTADFSKTQTQGQQYTSYRSQSRQSMSSQSQVDPELGQATMYKMTTTISNGRTNSALQIAKYIAIGDEWTYQAGCQVQTPSGKNCKVDTIYNLWNSIKPLEQRQSSDVVAKFSMNCDNTKILARVTPGNPTTAYDALKANTLYDILGELTGLQVTVNDLQQQTSLPKKMTFDLEVDYTSPLPRNMSYIINMLADRALYRSFPWVKVDSSSVNVPQGRMQGKIVYSPTHDTIDMTVVTPSQKRYSVHTPAYLYPMSRQYWFTTSNKRPVNISTSFDDLFYNSSSSQNDMNYAQCLVAPESQRMKVITFDHRTIDTPSVSPGCPVVLASDCSPSRLFVVIGTKTSPSQIDYTVKMNLPDGPHSLEISPSGGMQYSSSLVAKFDGRTIPDLSPSHPVTLSAGGKTIGILSMIGSTIKAEIDSLRIELDVRDSTDFTAIKVSHRYTSLCGVCGNKNGLPSDDLEGPDGRQLFSEPELVYNYLLPVSQCPMQQVRQQLGVRDPSELCQLEEKTYMTTRVINHQEKKCFSKESITLCPRDCQVEQVDSSSVLPMVCLQPDHMLTYRFAQLARQGGKVDELMNNPLYQPNYFEHISRHVRCVRKL